jgi:hypothetical protein
MGLLELDNFFSRESFEEIKEEVLDWLPNKIVDAHVHTATEVQKENRAQLKKFKIAREILKNGLEDKDAVYKRLFMDKEVLRVGFKLPLIQAGIDVSCNDKVMLKRMRGGLIGCMLYSEEPGLIKDSFKKSEEKGVKFKGVKLHPWLFNEDSFSIEKYFKEDFLEFCEKKKLTLICELPDGYTERNVKILKKVLNKYDIKIVIPHLGFNYKGFVLDFSDYQKFLRARNDQFKKEFLKIKNIKNLCVDTAMMVDQRIINAACEILGDERILWGTDYPFGFSPKIGETRIKTEELALALGRISEGEVIRDVWFFDFNVYLQIKALKNYFDKVQKSQDAVNNIFRDNALRVYGV